MLSRTLGIIVCVFVAAIGIACMKSGAFGPMLTGFALLLISLFIVTLIIWSVLEQSMNVIENEPDPFQDDFTYYRHLNTPDPHLIHPDDLKKKG